MVWSLHFGTSSSNTLIAHALWQCGILGRGRYFRHNSDISSYFIFKTKLVFSTAGDLADLIFVFFDPIGQALCKRTLNIVEALSEKHADRLKFYLSKADEAGLESDRQVWAIDGMP